MDYTTNVGVYAQLSLISSEPDEIDQAITNRFGSGCCEKGYIIVPSGMPEFKQTSGAKIEEEHKTYTIPVAGQKVKKVRVRRTCEISGTLRAYDPNALYVCPNCNCPMNKIGSTPISLAHIPSGDTYVKITVEQHRLKCTNPQCPSPVFTFKATFKADGHNITTALENYTVSLLAYGLTLKEVSHITGLHKSIVKDIDKKRLEELYTVNGEGKALKKPETYSEYIGIDEFKLHDGHKYATVIADLVTGIVLFVAIGKKKEVVYKFIDFMGDEWMKHVVAVAMDMNSDFREAFQDKYPHIKVIFDHFHIVKNFNDKVVSEVRKDEQKRLKEEGDEEAARELKGSKYILTSSRRHLKEMDEDARLGKTIRREATLFDRPAIKAKGGYEERYNELIKGNELLSACDIIKEKLDKAFQYKQEKRMRDEIKDIIAICRGTNNTHFKWFANLLEKHIDGITAHARYHISSGIMEGINNRTKTIRRKSYGLPDDDYFFLKIIDASHQRTRFS